MGERGWVDQSDTRRKGRGCEAKNISFDPQIGVTYTIVDG